MPLDYKIVTTYQAQGVWTRIAPYPDRLKNGLPHHWRLHVENEPEIFLVDDYYGVGYVDKENFYNEDNTQSTTGMTAWMKLFGDVEITQEGDRIIATIAVQKAPKDSGS